jgi:UDP-glucose 6-dehydrogenase
MVTTQDSTSGFPSYILNEVAWTSKCIPKDVLAWAAWAESSGYYPKVTWSILEQNEKWTGKDNNAERNNPLKAA